MSREDVEMSRKDIEKRWTDFKAEAMELMGRFDGVTAQLYETLAKLESSFRYGFPESYFDKK